MKIILTIKSLLNYLYNNLIDLIWVKKIKFEDGTELDSLPTSATLFDIKRRSINDISNDDLIQKGWCCISYPTQNKLNKANVPTAYNFLKDKLDNAEGTISPLTNVLYQQQGYNCLALSDDMVYYVRGYPNEALYKASYADFANTANWTKILDLSNVANVAWDMKNKLLAYFFYQSPSYKIAIVNLENGTKIAEFDYPYNSVNSMFFFENCLYIGRQESATYRYNLTTNTLEKVFDLYNILGGYGYIDNIYAHYNGYYYFNMRYGSNYYAFKASDIMDTQTYDGVTIETPYTIFRGISCYYNNKLYNRYGNKYYNLLTQQLVENIDLIANIKSQYSNQDLKAVNKVYFGYIVATSNYFFFTTDFQNFIELYNYGSYNNENSCDSNGSFLVVVNGWNLYCSAPNKVLTVYTDTINGIDIKYYKNGDWKICTPTIAVGNDDNLQSVYEYLGYLNYWWIDTTNEQITLQRDNIFETFMYVGDDYEDDSLPSGFYIPYATKQDVGNAGHTIIFKFTGNSGSTLDTEISLGNSCIIFKNGNKLSIVDDYTINGSVITFLTPLITSDKIEVMYGNITSVDLSQFKQKAQTIEIDTASVTIDNVLANKNYVLSNNAITDITLTACETSMEETTIQFTTGSSAPTLTDNSGLVWFGGIPTLQANTTYVIVIFNKQAFYQEQGV